MGADDQLFQRAMRAMDSGDLATAGPLLERLSVTHPHSVAIEASLGEIFASRNDWPVSVQWLERAVHDGKDPSAELLANLGTAYWRVGRAEAAKTALEQSLQLQDSNAQAEAILGDIEELRDQYDLAARHLLRAAEIDPTEERLNAAGWEFLRHWSFPPAIRTFTAALERYPLSADLRFGLAVAFYGAQQYDRAVPVLADLLANSPGQQRYARLFGQSCAALAESETPRCSEFVTYAEESSPDAHLLTLAAKTLMRTQTSAEDQRHAERLLQAALQKDAAMPEANLQMGLLQQRMTNWSGSVVYLREAIRARPDYTEAHYRLGLALAQLGRKQEANEEMKFEQRLSEEQKADLDRRLNVVKTIVVNEQPQN